MLRALGGTRRGAPLQPSAQQPSAWTASLSRGPESRSLRLNDTHCLKAHPSLAREDVAPTAAPDPASTGRRGAAHRERRNGADVTAASRNLNQRLLQAPTLSELSALARANRDCLTAVNLSTCLHKLAKLSAPRGRSKPATDATRMATALLTMLLNERPREDLDPRGLATCVWVAAQSHLSVPSAVCEQLMGLVTDAAPEESEALRDQELAMLLWGAARLGARNPCSLGSPAAAAVSALVVVLHPRIPRLNAQALSMVVWALATTGSNLPGVTGALATACGEAVPSFNNQGLSNSLWGLQTLAHSDPDLVDAYAASAAHRMRTERGCEVIDIAQVMWGVARQCGALSAELPAPGFEMFQPSDEVLASFTARPGVASFLACVREFVMLAGGAPPGGGAHPGCILPEGAAAAGALSRAEDTRGLMMLTWAASTLRVRDVPFWDVLAASLGEATPRLNLQDVSTALWSLGNAGFSHDELFEGLAARGVELMDPPGGDPREADPSAQTVSMSVWGIATRGPPSSAATRRFMEVLAAWSVSRLESFTSQGLANLVWGLAAARCVQEDAFRDVFQRARAVAAEKGSDAFSQQELAQLHQTELFLRLDAPELTTDFRFSASPQSILEQLYCAGAVQSCAWTTWERGVRQGGTHVSSFQCQVASTLEDLGFQIQMEYREAQYSIDIAVLSIRLAVEADGPTHYSFNTLVPKGATQLKHYLLRRLGWAVVSVPFFTWGELRSRNERGEYLHGLVSAAVEELAEATEAAAAAAPAPQELKEDEEAAPSEPHLDAADIALRAARLDARRAGAGQMTRSEALSRAVLRRPMRPRR